MDVLPSQELRRREQKRSIQVTAVDRKQVDLGCGIRAPDVSAGSTTRRSKRGDDHVSVRAQATPFDLDPQEVVTEVERKISPAVLGDWSQHGIPSFSAATTIACSATAPFAFEFITNICSHTGRTETTAIAGERNRSNRRPTGWILSPAG
jgi:hypothetical protein